MSKISRKLSLRFRMTFLVVVELAATVSLATFLSDILHNIFGKSYAPPRVIELLAIGIIVGATITQFLGRWFFNPIKKLGDAMKRVASGDFNIQLDTDFSTEEIREINSNFNLMVKELKATEVLQTDFVSNVSHEFKTPISAIEGYATLLQDIEHLSEEEQNQYINKILFNTRRLSDLVGNILLLSKLDNQAIQGKQTMFRLDEQIRQTILLLEPEWAKKDIEFDVEMENIRFCSNESLLHHVWYNLIGNAIKFNSKNGMVRIKLTQRDNKVIFTIDDNGPGINEEAQEHIFNKFYQADSSHKEEGNGLGLALVKKILSISNGEISVENLAGGGCRFTVILNE